MTSSFAIKAELLNVYGKNSEFLNGLFVPLNPNERFDLRQGALSAQIKALTKKVVIDKSKAAPLKLSAPVLAGIFVSRGGLTLKTRPHLTLSFSNLEAALSCFALASREGINFLQLFKPSRTVLYLKKWEQITDFLRFIGAHQALLELESERASNDLRSSLQRSVRLDAANQERLAASGQHFLKQLASIDASILRAEFHEAALLFFQLRRTHPHDSLAELVHRLNKRLGTTYTRQGASHWLRRLRALSATTL